MAVTKQWADGPFKLVSFSRVPKKDGKTAAHHLVAVEMIIVHNLILRGVNSICLQCDNIERDPSAIPDFVHYCRVWAETLEAHHDGEEAIIFPAIERACGVPGLMAGNIAQHAAFHDGLVAYVAYLQGVLDGREMYEGKRLRKLLDAFMPILVQHLEEEIDTLLALEKYEDKTDWAVWFKNTVAEVVKTTEDPTMKTVAFPFALQCHDATFEPGDYSWPPVPWIALLLLRWVFVPRNKAWWRFAPCDDRGRPKDLPYA